MAVDKDSSPKRIACLRLLSHRPSHFRLLPVLKSECLRRLVFDFVREILGEARRPCKIFFEGSGTRSQDYSIALAFNEDLVAIKTICFRNPHRLTAPASKNLCRLAFRNPTPTSLDQSTSSTALPATRRSRNCSATAAMSRQLRSAPICGLSDPSAISDTSKARSGANLSSASDVK